MSIVINNKNPKIKREQIECDKCNQIRICIRIRSDATTNTTNICRACWTKSHPSYLWCMWCGICGHLTKEDDYKICSGCDKTVGGCCGRLYYCQSGECICKECYDYKCEYCDTILDEGVYVSDVGYQEDIAPVCEACKSKPLEEIEDS